PAWLDRAVAFLQARGRHPYLVLEGSEPAQFRERFGGASALGRLDWRPIGSYAGPPVLIYDAVNRAGSEEPLAVANAASRRAGWRCDPPYHWPAPLRIE